MHLPSRFKKRTALAALILSAYLPSAFAQQLGSLDEIIVTAQKREQSLSDVPVSLNVVSAERLQAANINKIADLVEFVPNLSMTETAFSTQLFVRGVGSGNNQAFEQSVGQYVDGLYYSRQQLMRAPFLDLQRVEVLRGPQGTVFGKNSIAGALNLTTARPTREREFSVSGLYEFESAQREITAVASGALTDTLSARGAFRGYQEAGYVENLMKARDEPARDEDAVRLTLLWEPTDDVSATLKVERGTYDTQGRQIEIVRDDANLAPPGSSPLAGANLGQLLERLGRGSLDTELNFKRQADSFEYSKSQYDNLTLTLERDFGAFTLSSVTGRLAYDFHEQCDCDYTGANVVYARLGEDYEQWSQELRLASNSDGALSWMTGLYAQTADFNSFESISVPVDSVVGVLAMLSPDPRQRSFAAILGSEPLRRNAQTTDTLAWFGQAEWQFADNWALSVGGRFTREDKRAMRRLDVFALGTTNPPPDPRAPVVFYSAFNVHSEQLAALPNAPGFRVGHNLRGAREEHQFNPSASLSWHTSDNTLLYASASRGFKGGGFDARANSVNSFEFAEERVNAFELGSKGRYFDGVLELNAALFYSRYKDMQVSQFDGALGFTVGNAPDTQVSGLELDGRWAASDQLTVTYSYAYLDFKYLDFRAGNCYNRQVPDGAIVNGIALCDYTGKSGQYAPKQSASVSLDHRLPLEGGFTLASSLMLNHRAAMNLHENLDPSVTGPAVTRSNLRVALESGSWYAAFVGKNLTNEKVLSYAANVPMSAGLFGTNTFYGMVERGRQLALEVGMRL